MKLVTRILEAWDAWKFNRAMRGWLKQMAKDAREHTECHGCGAYTKKDKYGRCPCGYKASDAYWAS